MPALYCVIPAAGGGTRFGAGTPKQYAALAGVPLLAHTLDRMRARLPVDATLVAIARDDAHYEHLVGARDGVEVMRCGGLTRGETVRNALDALRGRAAPDDWVIVHDAARPCVPQRALLRLIGELWDDPVGGLLAIPVADTLKRADTVAGRAAPGPRVIATEDRAALWQAQTPQMFRYAVLAQALRDDDALASTDEAQAVERLGHRPRLVMGSPGNIKVTWPEDLALAEAILAAEAASAEPSP
jgi:2-C-methyl-D-erythritol 4-phosphate cytidylyltransferase